MQSEVVTQRNEIGWIAEISCGKHLGTVKHNHIEDTQENSWNLVL